ncbi:8181_t:CDS:2 [Cetraspora pellucida]|uniref:8181_t:CDS:1 n=1 Tax=Cetraspora pellucida TaxID=1433469 RepID=A0A9N9G035_9GLOM|nr:8181_t:CDS:2 [Cetraspora pellucida]
MNIAKFHIQLISSYWYYKKIDISNDLFLKANKFYNEKNLVEETASSITYLYVFSYNNQDFFEESLIMNQQRKIYEKLHRIYKTNF